MVVPCHVGKGSRWQSWNVTGTAPPLSNRSCMLWAKASQSRQTQQHCPHHPHSLSTPFTARVVPRPLSVLLYHQMCVNDQTMPPSSRMRAMTKTQLGQASSPARWLLDPRWTSSFHPSIFTACLAHAHASVHFACSTDSKITLEIL